MSARTITFNTSRRYTQRGQVITAAYDGAEKLLVADHSRGIYVEIAADDLRHHSDEQFARYVMNRYDNMQYRMSVEAMSLREGETILGYRL